MKTSPTAGVASESGLRGDISEVGHIARPATFVDDSGQFNVADLHAFRWTHAERLVRKLPCNIVCGISRAEPFADRIRDFQATLSDCRENPCDERKAQLFDCLDDIFSAGTGCAGLEILLARRSANKGELPRVFDHPETPTRTGSSATSAPVPPGARPTSEQGTTRAGPSGTETSGRRRPAPSSAPESS